MTTLESFSAPKYTVDFQSEKLERLLKEMENKEKKLIHNHLVRILDDLIKQASYL